MECVTSNVMLEISSMPIGEFIFSLVLPGMILLGLMALACRP